MGYEKFYGIKERPFTITPDPKFFYPDEQHMTALAKVKDAVDGSKGLAVIIGDIGVGKTFLSRKLLDMLTDEEDKYEASLFIVIHHEITATWMLKSIAKSLGVSTPVEDKTGLISQICRKITEIDSQGKKAIVLVDEAHMFQNRGIYEELRGLLNVEVERRKLLNIALFGPPELDKFMALDPPLVSRIGLKLTLQTFTVDSIAGYVKHRLKIACCEKDIFTDDVFPIMHKFSRGIPRLINGICENALLEGFMQNKEVIDVKIIEQVSVDLGLNQSTQEVKDKIDEVAPEQKTKKPDEASQERKRRISFL